MSWSVTVYNKNVSSQCNLTAHIEPVQDKAVYHILIVNEVCSFLFNKLT